MAYQVKVSLQELVETYDMSSDSIRHYLHLSSGGIAVATDLAETVDESGQAVEESELHDTDDYIRLPYASSHKGYSDMEDFIETVMDANLRKLLEVAINGKGAFRRFKDVLLDYPDERQRWFEFKYQQQTKRVEEWLADNDIQLI